MIVCNKFVFLHLHKSGGSFVNKLILSSIPYARQLGYHLPYSQLPASYRRLSVLGSVRNPWAYYVSWYAFQSQISQPNPLFLWASDQKRLNFEATIERLLDIGIDDSAFEQVQALLAKNFSNSGLNLTQACLQKLKGQQCGFYTFLYHHLYAGADNLHIVRLEHLKEELLHYFSTMAVEPQQKLIAYLKKAPRVNCSQHNDYQAYYSDTLRQRIEIMDGELIARYQYQFNHN